ncbi:MAG: TonB family protein [Chitinophagales bacterium]|nr:TonB family protein [Chitinophagales bacterium]MDW8419691.1 TonB family protein [Chitinophagales bacterium]
MKTDYLQTPMLDIIFENRNKAYGAYVLRSQYDQNLRVSCVITLTTVISLLVVHFTMQHFKKLPTGEKATVLMISDVILPKEAPQPKPIQPKMQEQPKGKQTVKNTEMRVTTDENRIQVDTLPPRELLTQVDPGLTTNMNTDFTSSMGVEGGSVQGATPELIAANLNNSNKIHDIVSQMPVFVGGEEGLMNFLRKHTKYPAFEQEAGIEGKAIIRFVVNADGTVSDPEVLRADSPGFGKEGVRVVKMLPCFQPGKQNGEPVRVYYVLPFTFRLY